MRKISPIDVYKLLPGTNCKECGEATCMAFASKLIDRGRKVEDCPLFEEEKYKEKKKKLIELLSPPIKEIVFGSKDRIAIIGGEEVMYRHELTYYNQTVFAFDIHDEMEKEEMVERVKKIEGFRIERVGSELSFDAIAVRSKSGDGTKFGDAVLTVVENSTLPLILCSYDPELLEIGVEITLDRRPLIYAATKDNWQDVAKVALKHECPVVASSPKDIEGLMKLTRNLMEKGVEDIILDIGTYPEGKDFADMMENLAMLRRLAIGDNVKEVKFPILGVPMAALNGEKDVVERGFKEASLASAGLLRFCDILILNSLDIWATLPLLTLRQNIYTDPRVPIKVDAGVSTIGKPGKDSPVFLTTNFALTYYTVLGDLESSKISSYLIVTDTEGLAVVVAVAGGKLVANAIKDTMDANKIQEKVKHRKLIIPGTAARMRGDIEDATKWEVLVGPMDSSRISEFLEKHWKA